MGWLIDFFGPIIILFAITFLLLFLSVIMGEHQCGREAAMMKREYYYDGGLGCMVKMKDGTFISTKNFRVVE